MFYTNLMSLTSRHGNVYYSTWWLGGPLYEENKLVIGGFSPQRSSNADFWWLFPVSPDKLFNERRRFRRFETPWHSSDINVMGFPCPPACDLGLILHVILIFRIVRYQTDGYGELVAFPVYRYRHNMDGIFRRGCDGNLSKALCSTGYPSETHLKPKSREISFDPNILLNYPIVWNFAQSTAVILPCSVRNFKTIGQM